MNKFIFLFCMLLASSTCFSQKLSVDELQCEHKINPLSINTDFPQLSWMLLSGQRGVQQTGYRILVSDNIELLKKNNGNIWDSKKIISNNTQVSYAGKKLNPTKKYYWKVLVWDNKNETAQSITAFFAIGLLTKSDWSNAQWIGYETMPDSLRTVPGVSNIDTKRKLGTDKLKQRIIVPLFRKSFSRQKKLSSAIIYISGLGQYELSVNAKKIGNSFLAPGWTHYDKRILYNTYDITSEIQNGENVLAVIVGNGFYNINRERYIKLAIAYGYPKIICKLLMTYSDGSTSVIVSDSSWKTTPSPITFTSLYGGEDYDARLEKLNWNKSGYSAAAWKSAVVVAAPSDKLEAEMDNAVQVMEVRNVSAILKPKDSVYVYDFAQNLSGVVQIKVKGKKGQVIKLSPGELLHSNALINQNATGKPYYFTYTLKGDGVEIWQPKFTYTGFRYVQVEGAVPDTAENVGNFAKIIHIQSLHTYNSSPINGNFECSNKLFNNINQLIKSAIKSNLQSVVTDCPHREKLGWLEQDYLMGNSINANYNVYHLYKKIVFDMMDAQTPEGLVPDIAPEFVFFDDNGLGFRDSPEWGSASVILPWLLYKWYADKSTMEKAFPMMKKYVAYLKSKSNRHILNYGLGDWYDNGPKKPGFVQLTPRALTATAIYYYDVKILAEIAGTLNETTDAVMYEKEARDIYTSFNDSFFNAKTKIYATGSQTAMAMPLSLGLVEEQHKMAVLQNLIDSINASGKKITAGDIGFHFLMQALQEGGASQLIYEMNFRDDVPGYGYQLKKGATSLTESWAALTEVSNNHLMLGHIMQWFYEGLAGISQSPDSYGYKHIVIRPVPVGDIDFVKANHQTIYGNIVCSWKKSNGHFQLDIEIPVNTTATVYLPAHSNDNITENQLPLKDQNNIKFIDNKNGQRIIEVGSGKYSFFVE